MKRIELNEKVKNAWDSLVQRNNKIIDLLNKVYEKKGPLASIGTKNGFSVDVHRLADEMQAILYKLRYASVSMEFLSKEYKKREEKIRVDQFINTDMKITEDLVFHIDVFFSFVQSALDFSGWVLHLVLGTKLPDASISFRNMVEYLAGKKRVTTDPLFQRLKAEIESGWLYHFSKYRHYANHWSFIVPQWGWKWTAKNETIETTIFMLPDDPREFPARYERRLELVPYCEEVLVSTLETISKIFDIVSDRLVLS